MGTLMAPRPGFKMMFAIPRFRAVASRMRFRKRSDFRPGCPPRNIQNVIARWQRKPIISILVWRTSRDLFFSLTIRRDLD
jgi:hypothetical protein